MSFREGRSLPIITGKAAQRGGLHAGAIVPGLTRALGNDLLEVSQTDSETTFATTRSRKRRVVFVAIVLGMSILVIEGSARVFLPLRQAEPTVPLIVGAFDPLLGWSLKPGAVGVSRRTGVPVEYRINSKGLRDGETTYEKPADTFRIAVIGDSRSFGFGVPIEKHFSRLLEGYFRNVEVINLGVSGFGVDQELLMLREEGFKYAPDLVIAYVAHFGAHRHMHTLRFGKRKPRFQLVDGALVLVNSPVESPEANSVLNAPSGVEAGVPGKSDSVEAGVLRDGHRLLRRYSRAYEILRTGIVQWVEPEALNRPRHQRLADQKDAEDEAFRHETGELAEAIIRAMHDDSRDRDADFLLVTHIERLHDFALSEGIHSLDVTIPLNNPLFPVSEELMHLNESGNGVLTWEIAKYLRDRKLVPADHLSR